MKKYIKLLIPLSIILFFSILTVLPFFHSGFFPVHDDTQIARVFEMNKALSQGSFPVREVMDLGYGYGYPIFNFYAPLPYYVGGFIMFFGLDALSATKIMFVLGFMLSGFSMYFLVKRFAGEFSSVCAALLYLFFPYHALNAYVRGDVGEIFAYGFFPLVFLSLSMLIDLAKSKKHVLNSIPAIAFCASSIALVIVSHNLSFFILAFFIIIFIGVSMVAINDRKNFLLYLLASLLLAFLLSAFYTIPMIFEIKYTNVASQLGGGASVFDHFVCANQLWDSPWGFGGSAKGCIDGMSFRIGKVYIVLFLLSVAVFIFLKKKKNKFIFSLSVGLCLISVFMTTEYSKFIWQFMPFSSFLQYPWRFINFAGLFLVLSTGIFLGEIEGKTKKRLMSASVFVVILLILITNFKLFNPQKFFGRNSDYYTSTDYIRFNTSKVSDEYMPSDFNKPKNVSDLRNSVFDFVSGAGTVKVLQDRTIQKVANISVLDGGIIRANIAYFPAWNIFLDGKKIVYAAKADGLYFPIVQGEHTVNLSFRQTAIEVLANALSLGGFICLFLGIIIFMRRANYGKKTS